jgi:DNA mismatch repair protein MSH3
VTDMKSKHPGMILLFECGYRYRFFGSDAEVAAKVLDISANQGSILQNSIPAEKFSDRFSSSNFGLIFIKKTTYIHKFVRVHIMDNNLEL